MVLAENNQPLSQAIISHNQQYVMTLKQIRHQKRKLRPSFLNKTPNLDFDIHSFIQFQTHVTTDLSPWSYHQWIFNLMKPFLGVRLVS